MREHLASVVDFCALIFMWVGFYMVWCVTP